MGMFSSLFGGSQRKISSADREKLRAFASTRVGVRAYFEEETPRASASLLLVAQDGEWTRKTVASRTEAHKVAEKLNLAFFDVAASGYPAEMRKWNLSHR